VSISISRWLIALMLVFVDKLDRVLDRHNVASAVPVDVIDHRGQRRRLARTRRPRNQHETPAAACTISLVIGGSINSSIVLILTGIDRSTAPILPRCRKQFTRNLDTPFIS
jgi:hypothetical protein